MTNCGNFNGHIACLPIPNCFNAVNFQTQSSFLAHPVNVATLSLQVAKMLFRLLICEQMFISRLVRVNLNQFLIGKMYVLLCVLLLYIWIYTTNCRLYFSHLVIFFTWLRLRGTVPLSLAIAPEFFYCSYMCLFYVFTGLLKYSMCVYVCMCVP